MYIIHTDSSIEPMNPEGILTWAFIVRFKGKFIHQEAKIHGWGKGMTNNLGECLAVLAAMRWLLKLPKKHKFITFIYSDSKITVKHCTGEWNTHEERLKKLHHLIDCARLAYGKSIKFLWTPREKNTEADKLSRSLYTPKMINMIKENYSKMIFGEEDISF